jgi:hypothetical protein
MSSKRQKLAVAAALVLGFAFGVAAVSLTSCAAPALAQSVPTYAYIQFIERDCAANGGEGVIDLRNGKAYCVPWDGSAPILVGTLNLAGIPGN